METEVKGSEVQPATSGDIKDHFNKHKRKYLFAAGLLLAMGVGYHIANRGNSKHHYARLLRDGVQSAVEDGIKDVVDRGMRDVVKDGMRDVIKEVMNDEIVYDIRRTVHDTVKRTTGEAVRNVIKESGITIIKEVETKSRELADTEAEDLEKALKYITNGLNGVKLRVDENGNVYVAKHTV